MKNENVTTNPIGLAQDFSELFGDVSRNETSSNNWLQQYQSFRDANRVRLEVMDNILSTNLEAFQYEWCDFSTKNEVLPLSNEEFADKYKNPLKIAIEASPINTGEDTEATLFFSKLISENKISTLFLVNDIFIKNVQDDIMCVKIISLFNDYSYDELNPTAQTIAALSINHKSKRVKSAAMNLFSHWGNKKAYELLCAIECPNEDWIKMKYNTIKKSLGRRWSMQER